MSASPTTLTLGPFRLHLPPNAPIPSLRTSPTSSAIEVTFANFSGAVVFEPVDPCSQPPLAPSQQTRHDLSPPTSQSPLHSPHSHFSHPISSSPPCSQPLFLPTHNLSQPPSQPHSQAISSESISMSQPLTQPMSQQLSQPLSQPVSQPFSQPLSQSLSQPLPQPLAQGYTPLSPQLSQPASQPFSQILFEQPLSQSISPSESPPHREQPPPIPMETRLADASYMALTPPSSQENDLPEAEDAPMACAMRPLQPVVKKSCVKRAPVSPEFTLAVKTGKRVRFQKDPQVFSQASLPVLESPMEADKLEDKKKAVCNNDEEMRPVDGVNEVGKKVDTPVCKTNKPSPWRVVEVPKEGDVPEKRWGATFTRLDNETVVLLGGESDRDGFFDGMAVLDVRNNGWVQGEKDTPAMPNGGRAWHTTTCVDVNLFVFGGEMDVNGGRTQTNEALIYDSTYFTWYPPSLSGNKPVARAGHCAALLPGTKNVVIFGGINGNKWLNDLHLLEDLSVWSKMRLPIKSARPCARSYASLTSVGGFLLLFGGNNKTKCFNDVHLLDPKEMSWSEPVILGRAPRPRTGHCATASEDGKGVIVYGGWDDQGAQRLFFSDVWKLEIKSVTECRWCCLYAGDNSSRTPGPRAGSALEVIGREKKMYLFGGWHQFSYYNDLTQLCLPFSPKTGGILLQSK